MDKIEAFDNQEIYCRTLGHELTFSYCRNANLNTPCKKIRDCWFERINIEEFLNNHYTTETLSRLEEPPKPKILSLYELIQKAQEMKKKE